jgi:predicted transcriptional regulator
MTPISDQIRAAVRESGYSQREFAQRADVPLSLIVRFLRGGSITSVNLDRILMVIPPKIKNKLRP